ncbi:MAG: hypothetical protein V8Q42_03540 [Anaerovoracaceae bacterium]
MSTALCPVGGAAVAAEIANIMGVEAEDVAAKVATVMCAGSNAVTSEIMEADRIHTCKAAKNFFEGRGHVLTDAPGLETALPSVHTMLSESSTALQS